MLDETGISNDGTTDPVLMEDHMVVVVYRPTNSSPICRVSGAGSRFGS
jgi:hypothetical protein